VAYASSGDARLIRNAKVGLPVIRSFVMHAQASHAKRMKFVLKGMETSSVYRSLAVI
jgi:hypothetical protein